MFSIPQIYAIVDKFPGAPFEGYVVNIKNNLVYRITEWEEDFYIPRNDNIGSKYGADSIVQFHGWGNDLPNYLNNEWELIITEADNFDGTWDIDLAFPNWVHYGSYLNYAYCKQIIELLQPVPYNHMGPFVFNHTYTTFETKFNYDPTDPYVYKFKNRVSYDIIILETDETIADVSDHYKYVVVDTKTKKFLFRDDDYINILKALNNTKQHYSPEDIDTRTEELLTNLKV